MNPIALAMDGLLAGLLILALIMGVRLNGRLKALRESHAGFAKAVGELDAAAAKADAALRSLRGASETAHDELLARIESARALVTRLENAADSAEKSAKRAETAATLRPPEPLLHAPAAAPAPASAPRRALAELLASYESRAAAPHAEPAPAPAPAKAPLSSRRRPMADEELFADAEAGVRPSLSGLMRMSLTSGKGAR